MNKKVKKVLLSVMAFSIAVLPVFGGNKSIKAAEPNVTVNLSQTKQVIRGFGGMNHVAWIGDLTEAQRETAFGRGKNQLGLSIVRIYVDSNKDNWYKELPTAKKVIEEGCRIN